MASWPFPNLPPQHPHSHLSPVGSPWSPVATDSRSRDPQKSFLKSDCRISCCSLTPGLDRSTLLKQYLEFMKYSYHNHLHEVFFNSVPHQSGM